MHFLYLYLIFIINIVLANINVIELAIITGKSFILIPYKSHKNTPAVNILYMPNDMPEVFFSLITFIACGKKELVVNTAAKSPTYSTIYLSSNLTTDSICAVCGNISTGWTSTVSYPFSSRSLRSLANVAGSQDT